jgi:hypothetical protein
VSFEKEFNKATEIVIDANEKVVRGAALELFGAIIKLTPVDTGRLRGNWQASVNSSLKSVVSTTDKGGSSTITRAKSAVNKFALKDVIYFTNNLPYAEVIENGSAGRRPNGMVRNSVKAFIPYLEKMARKYKK